VFHIEVVPLLEGKEEGPRRRGGGWLEQEIGSYGADLCLDLGVGSEGPLNGVTGHLVFTVVAPMTLRGR